MLEGHQRFREPLHITNKLRSPGRADGVRHHASNRMSKGQYSLRRHAEGTHKPLDHNKAMKIAFYQLRGPQKSQHYGDGEQHVRRSVRSSVGTSMHDDCNSTSARTPSQLS